MRPPCAGLPGARHGTSPATPRSTARRGPVGGAEACRGRNSRVPPSRAAIESRHMGRVGYYRLLEPKRLTWEREDE